MSTSIKKTKLILFENSRPNEQIPDEPMDASPRKEDLSSSPLTSPKRQDDSQLIILDDEDEDGNAEQAREEMEIDLYFR